MKKLTFLVFTVLYLGIGTGRAQYTVLHSFNSTDGLNPWSTLAISGNVLYGISGNGGANNDGCIFSFHTDGSSYIDLFDFNITNGRGAEGSLLLLGNKLYGMATYGGLYGQGNLFSIDTNGNQFKVLLDFNNLDGATPAGSLMASGKLLFGMTSWGGINNKGEVFSIDTSGNNFKDLLDFNVTNGERPWGDVVLAGRTLFGMSSLGGANGVGNIFSIDSSGGNFKDLLDFNGANGKSPRGSLTLSLSGSVLYGMTGSGGLKDSGCVFSIDTSGAAYRDLLDFGGLNGVNPATSYLTLSGSTLYGMTNYGGTSSLCLIFSIDTDRTGFKDLFDFNTSKGAYPAGSLTLSGNTFYGTTSYGGSHFDGVVFKLQDTSIVTSSNKLTPTPASINVYPNPSGGTFTFQTSVVRGQLSVEVYNVLGEKVYSQSTIDKAQWTVNLTSQPDGVYFYRIISNTGSLIQSGKLLIEK